MGVTMYPFTISENNDIFNKKAAVPIDIGTAACVSQVAAFFAASYSVRDLLVRKDLASPHEYLG